MLKHTSIDNIDSDQGFKLGYWLFLHKKFFRKLLIGFLIVVAIVSFGYSSVKWASYLAGTRTYEEMLLSLSSSQINYQAWHEKNKPLEVEVMSVVAVPVGQNYDLVAQVKNPNLQYALSKFDYTFTVKGQVKVSGSSFILPREEKFILATNITLDEIPSSALGLSVANTSWYRIKNLKEITLPDFTVANQKIEDLFTLTDGRVTGTRLTFDLTNYSLYGFWDIRVISVLTSGNQIRAVAARELKSLDVNTTVSLQFDWTEAISGLTNAIIKPEVNVLDPSVFKLR